MLGTLGLLFVLVTNVHVTQCQDFQRTIVMFYADTAIGESMFIRGGISHDQRPGCVDDAQTSACAIPIVHRIRPTDTLSQYYQWSEGDNYLDWYGEEVGQGDYLGDLAGGTPLIYTEDSFQGTLVEEDGFGYTPLNRFGSGYWMMDVDMDCSASENGWFELKGFAYPYYTWEVDINQYPKCAGVPDLSLPFSSTNHFARCGKMNVFFWTEPECNVFEIPSNPEQPPPSGCGQRQIWDIPALTASAPQIVNGNPAVVGRWPWQGVLQYGASIGGCAATLIDSDWALTAAHCVRGTDPAILSVRFGEQNLEVDQNNEQVIPALDIIMHPGYENPAYGGVDGDYDIAMISLSRVTNPLDLSSYIVNPGCMPYGYDLDNFVGLTTCWATGFGGTLGTSESVRINEINIPVWSHGDCVAFWGDNNISVRQVCMGTNTESPCGGDSGGPLVCYTNNEWVIVGLTSWGSSGCQNGPAVYTRVSEFTEWIDSIRG